jgi:Holliday junction resolvase RusA-like endonuclease
MEQKEHHLFNRNNNNKKFKNLFLFKKIHNLKNRFILKVKAQVIIMKIKKEIEIRVIHVESIQRRGK